MTDPLTPLVAIVGPTASGKTGLAIELAKLYDGEIICADSRTIYRGMDIGTAKPSYEDREGIPHHLLDIIEPDESYSAQQFKVAAERLVTDIARRGKLPIVVGGTGLYVYSLLYDYQFPAGARSPERAALEAQPLDELVARLRSEDAELAGMIDLANKRRVVRAIETAGQPRQKSSHLPSATLLLGLRPEQEVLNQHIVQRTKAMLQIGLVDEVQSLVRRFGATCEPLRSPGYAEIIDYLNDRSSIEQAQELIALHTRQLAKRQLTWLRRNDEISWHEGSESALAMAQSFLGPV